MDSSINEPTDLELSAAWTRCIEAESFPFAGPLSEAKMELRRLRDLRMTWYGKELILRRAIDAYLDNVLP